MNIACETIRSRELLTVYLGGTLEGGEHADVDGHLASCPACTAHVAVYRRITCRGFIEEHLGAYVDGTLPPDVVADLERHLEICPPCVAFMATYRRVPGLVKDVVPRAMPDEMRAVLRRFLGARIQSLGLLLSSLGLA